LSAALRVHTAQPRRDHAGIVEDQNVARPQVLEQVREAAMFDGDRVAMKHQETGLIAFDRRRLSDQFGRQCEIKIGGLHAAAR
jgi:hypothetical protein